MRLTCDSTSAVIIDVQERLLPVMHEAEPTLNRIVTLIRGLGFLDIPVIMTEQYPKGLGSTVTEVTEAMAALAGTPSTDPSVASSASSGSSASNDGPVVKSAFSCCDDRIFAARLDAAGRSSVLVAGIEAHVCVLQTTIDLLDRGYLPVVVTDATSSRNPRDRDIAFRRMETEGARLTTVESVLFELTRESGTPLFKEISRLVK